MSWTFGGVAFSWFMPTINGLPAAPTWQREPRIIERPLLGTGNAAFDTIGYLPWRLSGSILVSNANRAAFTALNGTAAALSDGTTTWTAVLSLELSSLYVAADGATGTASFARPNA